MSALHQAAQRALEQLKINRTNFRKGPSKSICKMLAGGNDEAIEALEAALADPVPHGCHVDLEPIMKPDGCVLDEGRPHACVYARRLLRDGKDKTACGYWRPIEVMR